MSKVKEKRSLEKAIEAQQAVEEVTKSKKSISDKLDKVKSLVTESPKEQQLSKPESYILNIPQKTQHRIQKSFTIDSDTRTKLRKMTVEASHNTGNMISESRMLDVLVNFCFENFEKIEVLQGIG